MKKGFTLAEVLITLGIIGVVAAMTIPTLIQNTNSVRFATQFKKDISTLSQAALMSQAQYETDYSLITASSADNSCASDTIAGGKMTMCGLFNNTLAGQTYQGTYGTVKGADAQNEYKFTKFSTINPAGFLLYALADGSMVGFSPDAKNCALAAGNVLDNTMLAQDSVDPDTGASVSGGGLKNCVGFVDVNGVTPPNREVTCANGTATLNPKTPCALANTGSALGDVYPIVFHDGTVEPASDAARAVLARGKTNTTGGTNAQNNLGGGN